jgi:uncharacterized protein (TIGR03083 family)
MQRPPAPVHVAGLFGPLHDELLALLRGLDDSDWHRPTLAREWCVADVAAHILDVDLRRIALLRDGHAMPPPSRPLTNADELVAWLDTLNAEWVRAARRLSPALLVELLALSGPRVATLLAELDPAAPARLPVVWAGQSVSPNWLDVGRELTERWHHQQQIRLAVGEPPLESAEWLRPVLAIALHALPHAYRSVSAPAGAAVRFEVRGAAGGAWSLVRGTDGWLLHDDAAPAAACGVTIGDAVLARLLHHLIPAGDDVPVTITGDNALATPLLATRAVMIRAPSPAPHPGTRATSDARPS